MSTYLYNRGTISADGGYASYAIWTPGLGDDTIVNQGTINGSIHTWSRSRTAADRSHINKQKQARRSDPPGFLLSARDNGTVQSAGLPVTLVFICLVALLASGLTFFSGFGLGTLLMPAFALFFPVEQAIALTGVVHFLNGLFKLALVGKDADRGVLIRFGLPALVASFVGALVLARLADVPPITSYELPGMPAVVTPVKLAIGALLLVFASLEFSERFARLSLPPRYLPVGGEALGGLAGMQGALRSAFLLRAGLDKQAFIGTGVAIAVLIDLSRVGVYATGLRQQAHELDYPLLAAAVLSAFAGAYLGNRYLKKLTMKHVQGIVAVLLFAVALGLISGVM